ncbi:MAG: TIGR03619 family F420-dependent LLM class oxidoreductase [bacterium]|nr:TIGR03619 family F420-dependent LLM class oxidoreductase [bacterium]MDE0289197.1 TIGR03619 family F420-dependent LLM class oxidoreductase [bacterium]MDE0436780.1 TIGR03619 family F420-dependent LLM class oxidoreductase [bacterium]
MSGPMRIGASIFFTAESIQPAELGVELEARGFESLWLPEHSHMPLAQQRELGDRRLPEKYEVLYDAFTSLAAVASATSRILLGTGITLLGIRDPIWTAKAAATLDRLSGGRFLFGIGYGWLRREYESHGIPFDRRRAITREKLRVVKALWTTETTEFTGDRIHLLPSRQGPKPIQRPHPPVHIGAALGPGTKADLASLADGWIPLGMYRVTSAEIAEVQAAAATRGRGPLEISVYLDYTAAHRIEEMAEIGCDRVVVCLPTAPRAEVLEYVEQIAEAWIAR